MKKCEICGRFLNLSDAVVLFVDEKERIYEICLECEKQVDTLNKEVNDIEAINYVQACAEECQKPEVRKMLLELIDKNTEHEAGTSGNMFKKAQRDPVSKSIDDCIQVDELAKNLWKWASRLDILGKVLMWLIIIAGIIMSILSGSVIPEKFNFTLFFTSLYPFGIYAFLDYCVFHVLALLISALAGIYHNTRQSARLLEYQIRNDSGNKQS